MNEPERNGQSSANSRRSAEAALANIEDFIRNGKKALTPDDIENLKAVLSLDAGLLRAALTAATPTAGAGGLADVERLHKMLGTEGEGIGVWVHRPQKVGDWTSPEGSFYTFRVEDVHAAIDKWAALAPVAHRPTPAEPDR